MTNPNSGSPRTSPRTRHFPWRGLSKMLMVSALAGTCLFVIARSGLWQEDSDSSDPESLGEQAGQDEQLSLDEPSLTVNPLEPDRQSERPQETIRIGRQASGGLPTPERIDPEAPVFSNRPAASEPQQSEASRSSQQGERPPQDRVVSPDPEAEPQPETAMAEPTAAAPPRSTQVSQPTQAIAELLAPLLLPPGEFTPIPGDSPPLTATVPGLSEAVPEAVPEAIPALPPERTPPRFIPSIEVPPLEVPPTATLPEVRPPESTIEPEVELPVPTTEPEAEPSIPTTELEAEPSVAVTGTEEEAPLPALPGSMETDAAPTGETDVVPGSETFELPAEPEESSPPQTVPIPNEIQVEQFVVTGSTVFDPEDLAAIALTAAQDQLADNEDLCDVQGPLTLPEPLNLTPSQLIQASDAISKCYIDRNYISSGAFIAESELTEANDGTIEITVVEGRLETINVEVMRSGLFGLNPSYVESRLDLALGDPFNLEELLEAVRLLELDPLINRISTEIVPGTETGTSILDVSVEQDDGFEVNFFLDNDRSPSVGSFRRGIGLSQANLLGLGDRLSLGYNFTGGSDEFSLGYSVPINPLNGVVGFNFTTTDSEVIEEPFTILDIESEATTYELFYRQPIILTPTQELALSLRASRRSSQALFLEEINMGQAIPFPSSGADAEGNIRITALRFGQEWITRSSQQVIALLSEFSFGLDLFNATTQPIPPDGTFFLWRGQGQWVRSLAPDSLFILRGNIQLADQPLLATEQFSFGGQRAGRGYRLNTLLRDNGWFLSTEFRVPLFRLPEDNILMQVAPFFDVGGGWNSGDLPDTLFLTSTGLGLIFDFDDTVSARLDWGIPLSDFESTGNSLQDSGVHFFIRLAL